MLKSTLKVDAPPLPSSWRRRNINEPKHLKHPLFKKKHPLFKRLFSLAIHLVWQITPLKSEFCPVSQGCAKSLKLSFTGKIIFQPPTLSTFNHSPSFTPLAEATLVVGRASATKPPFENFPPEFQQIFEPTALKYFK